MPIKLTGTLEGDLIFEIIKVKSGLYISRKDSKHIGYKHVFQAFQVCLGLHIVVSDCSVHEIFANDILTALKPSFRT